MNKLISEVCRILDFPEEYADLAMKEADYREKLRGVYMFVNGKLCWITGYEKDSGTIKANGEWILVDTLDVWLPETGIYTSSRDGTKILLQKRPIKQWKKSFSLDYYIMSSISADVNHEGFSFADYANSKAEIIHHEKSIIRAFTLKIGEILPDNTVKCLRPEFYQEIIDHSTRKGLQWNVSL